MSSSPAFADSISGDLLGAIGILHGLGLSCRDPDIAAFEEAIPKGRRPILRWRLPEALRDDPSSIDEYQTDQLDEVIKLLGQIGNIRIELGELPRWHSPEWFVSVIGTAKRLNSGSVYLYHQARPQMVPWQWPLRVGFFDDPAARRCYEELREVQQTSGGWLDKIVQLLPPSEKPGQCGIALVPSLEQASRRLFSQANRLHCGILLILNWDEDSDLIARAAKMSRDVLDSSWASGVAVVDAQQRDNAQIFFDTIQHLSHNESIDSSLVASCLDHGLNYPLITGSTALMRDSRLSRVMGSVRKMMENPNIGSVLEFPSKTRGPGESRSLRGVAGDLRRFELEGDIFAHEGDISMEMAEIGEAFEAMTDDPNQPQTQGPRRLHCTLRDEGGNVLHKSFQAGKRHEIKVGIGAPPRDAIRQDVVVPFPDEELPPDQDEYELTVMFAKLSGDGIPSEAGVELDSKKIKLPKGSGDSSSVTFEFVIAEDEEVFEGRVIVLFRNRIMQTGRLSGAVGEPASEGKYSRIRFEIEALISRYFSGLEDPNRVDFGHALLFNDNLDGNPGLTAVSGGQARISAPQGLAEEVERLNKLVSIMARDIDTYTGTLDTNSDLLKFMIAFARDGEDLRDMIERSIPASSQFDSHQPIQVLTKTEGSKIPIEFLYDYPAPKTDATLCPGALNSLQADVCPHDHSRDVFCPSGFWGLNRVIERHEYSAEEPDQGFVLKNESTATRRTISIGDKALFAGTKVVDDALGSQDGLAKIKQQLDVLTEQRCVQVQNWEEWKSAVDNSAPGLLVLIVHTEFEPLPFKEQKLEIGDDQWLLYNDIRPDLVTGGSAYGPVVFLIGCKTGSSDIRYRTLSEKFKRAGASIVISSSATIHSKHAVPVLQRLVELLGERAGQNGFAFGEVMRIMRRQMLADGNPIILSISAYGDADWLLI